MVEEIAGAWLEGYTSAPRNGELFPGHRLPGWPTITCLAAARHALLSRRQWDVEVDGLAGSPPIRILTSTEKHGTTSRAIRLLGLGEKHITKLDTDAEGRLRADALNAALHRSARRPPSSSCRPEISTSEPSTTSATLIPIAKQAGAWVHIDGAFGLWAAASTRLRHLLNGANSADSWATDGHKWLNVPFDCGYAFVADVRKPIEPPSRHRAAYIDHNEAARDQIDWNPEWFPPRARGFATPRRAAPIGQAWTSRTHRTNPRSCARAGNANGRASMERKPSGLPKLTRDWFALSTRVQAHPRQIPTPLRTVYHRGDSRLRPSPL